MEAEDSDLRAEDEASASLEAQGGDQQFCDYDFIPHPRSLYVNEHFVPSYDQGVHNDVTWCRPLELFADPQYFKTASYTPKVQDGRCVLLLFCGLLRIYNAHQHALALVACT